MNDNLLPADLEAERSVLSAILIDQKAIYTALSILETYDFQSERHQVIFDAMAKVEDDSETIDIFSLKHLLKHRGQLEKAGGFNYLESLEGFVPTAQMITHHCKFVKAGALAKKLAYLGESIHSMALEGMAPNEIIDTVLEKAYEVKMESEGLRGGDGTFTPEESAHSLMESVESWLENPEETRGVATGFHRLDTTLNGLKDVNIVSASTGFGKTAFALNIATNIGISQKVPCLYINHEMNVDELNVRILGILSNIPIKNIMNGIYNDAAPFVNITRSAQKMSDGKLFLTNNKPKNINAVIAMIQKFKAQHGIKVVVVDYLGEIEADKLSFQERSEYLTYGRWVQQLKNACTTAGVKLVLLAQLNRDGEETPNKNKIGGSYKIAQKADVFLILGIEKGGEYFVRVDKNRNGPAPITIPLGFRKETQRIEEI